jgi:hypothetical protein
MMNVDCREPDVLGPRQGVAFSETVVDLDFPLDAKIWLTLEGDVVPGSGAALIGCVGCADAFTTWLAYDDDRQYVEIPDGRYVLRLFRPIDEPGELGIRLQY